MADADRIAELLAEYFERISAGESLEPETFVQAHAEVADALREHLDFAPVVDEVFAPEAPMPERLGPYRVLEVLGTGGMGTVYRASVEADVVEVDAATDVALKLVHPHLLQRPGFFKRFLREAEVGRSVEHANVVRTFDVDALVQDNAPYHYLVMEYVEGQTLRGLLDELEVVPEELCRHIGREVAKGLVAIHEAGVVHRDLKPDNVIITRDHVVKVMDLGVARLTDEAIRLSQTGHFVGSVEYAAPEQFTSSKDGVDARSDLFALGVVLYELATGRHPFRDESARVVLHRVLEEPARKVGEVNPQLSPFLEELVDKLLQKSPEGRFQTAQHLLEVLEQGEAGTWWRERAKQLQLETRRPLRRVRVPRETALYGRDGELQQLNALYAKAKAGDGQVLLIEGEAGIGKTRLVDEFVGRLRQAGEDLNFLFGSYPPGGAATASGAFSTAYREQLGEEGLDRALDEHLRATPTLVRLFAALLRGEPPPRDASPLNAETLRTAFVHVTRSLARERPTIVLIDDLHFAHDDGRALFAALALAAPGHPFLLVGTMRPGVPEGWIHGLTRLDYVSLSRLGRLGPKDLAGLLRDAFQSERLAEELAYKIGTKSDGNPFFVFEIIRGLKEGQFLRQRPDGSWVTTRIIRDLEVPSSVLDLVSARIADLDRPERDLLDLASCCGYEFDPLLVAAAADSAPIPVLQALAGIEKRHRLVRSAGSVMVFDHHQVQEAIYQAMPRLLAEAYHAELAKVLESRAGGQNPSVSDGSLCVAIAEHWLRSGQRGGALPWLDRALEHLAAAWENDRSAGLLESVLGAPGLVMGGRRAGLLLRLGRLWDLAARRGEQEEVLDEALQITEEQADKDLQARVLRELGNLYWRTGRFAAAESRHERVIELARELGDVDMEAAAVINRGNAREALDRREEAARDQERGLELARRCGNLRWEANALMNLGLRAEDVNAYESALDLHDQTRRLALKLGDRLIEARAHGNLGRVLRLLGRYAESQVELERYQAIAREIGDRRGEGVAAGNLGTLLLDRGRVAEGRAELERYEAIAVETGNRAAEAAALGGLASATWRAGRLEESLGCFRRVLQIEQEAGSLRNRTIPLGNLGVLLLSLGQTEEARRHLEEALSLARRFERRRVESYQLHSLGLAEIQAGDLDAAKQYVRAALELRDAIGYAKGRAESLMVHARLRMLAGDRGGAQGLFEEALRLADEIGLPDVALVACASLATWSGDASAALDRFAELEPRLGALDRMEGCYLLWQASGDRPYLERAKEVLDQIVEHAPEVYRTSMRECVPLHRDVESAWAKADPIAD